MLLLLGLLNFLPPSDADWLVVTGRSLGHLKLGADASTLAALGKAGYGDAAMQKAWATWYGSPSVLGAARSQLDVYTAPQSNDVDHHTVQVVRATSPWFHLAGGLRPGSALGAVRASYGGLPLAATYRVAGSTRYLYDDVAHGIAFEADGTADTACCQALIVHAPGRAVAQTYLPLPAYLPEVPAQ